MRRNRVSTADHVPFPLRTRTGKAFRTAVSVPLGLAYTWDSFVRNPVTSTGFPAVRAARSAPTSFGISVGAAVEALVAAVAAIGTVAAVNGTSDMRATTPAVRHPERTPPVSIAIPSVSRLRSPELDHPAPSPN